MLPVIIVFAKAPVPGRVKTRLIPRLGPEGAAELHRGFVHLLLDRLRGGFDVELHTDVETSAWRRHDVPRKLQCAGDLGDRILYALESALHAGRPQVTILGADVPTLPLALIEDLLALDADVALGPAEDGGYWAITCRRTHPEMFAAVEWSTSAARAQTLAACQTCGLTTALGGEWFDVDEPADLDRL